MKTKKLYRTRRRRNSTMNRMKRTYKRRIMKGGERPELNVLKNINLFNNAIGEFINPFYGCAYVETKVIDTLHNLYKLPVEDTILDPFETQHNRLIGLVFHSLDDRVEPIHKLRDNDTLSINDLSKFIALRLVWTMYSKHIYNAAIDYIRLNKQVDKLSNQLGYLLRTNADKHAETLERIAAMNASISSITDNITYSLTPYIRPYKLLGYDDETFKLIAGEGVEKEHILTDKRFPMANLRMIVDDVENRHLNKIRQLIPLGTPMNKYSFHILMSLLWWKCPTKSHFIEFYTVIKQYIDIFMPRHTFEIPAGFADDLYTAEDLETITTDDPYGTLYKVFNNVKYIAPIGFAKTRVDTDAGKIKFTDCGESTIRNFIRIMAYNPETGKTDMRKLAEWGAIPEVMEYFEKYPIGVEERQQKARDDWATIVSHREEVHFIKNDICEIHGNHHNIFMVLTKLFRGIRNIKEFQTDAVRLLYVGDPDEREHIMRLIPDVMKNPRNQVVYVITYNDDPIFLWKEAHSHAHIESYNKNKIMFDWDLRSGSYNELIQYSMAISMTEHEQIYSVIQLFEPKFNPYLIHDEIFGVEYDEAVQTSEELLDKLHPTLNHGGIYSGYVSQFKLLLFVNPATDKNNMSILLSLDRVPYKYIVQAMITKVNYTFSNVYNNTYNIVYLVRNCKAIRKYIEFDAENRIKSFNTYLTVAEFEQLEQHRLISPELRVLNINATDWENENTYTDNMNRIFDTYHGIDTFALSNKADTIDFKYGFRLRGITTLKLPIMNAAYVIDDSVKTLMVNKFLDSHNQFIPKSVETLLINELRSTNKIIDELPNLRELYIFNIMDKLERAQIPSTVKSLHIGINQRVDHDKFPYFGLLWSKSVPLIMSIPDNIEELYIYCFNKSKKPLDRFMHIGALSALKKLSVDIDMEEDTELSRNRFRALDESIVLEGIRLVG
jgi:hypothetical protein